MKKWRDFPVEELVPHAGKMMLLNRVIEFEPETMVAEVIVGSGGLFEESCAVPAWVGIEYMAQTVAALGGMKRRLAGKPITLGFLLGTRRYECNVDNFSVGTILTVSVRRVMQDQGLGVFDCRIAGEGISASAKLNVYQPESATNRAITD
jgi:predicted hotdog family 3-hydroxylacyl-ACP dehydratase